MPRDIETDSGKSEGYRGNALKLLQRFQARPGYRVKIKTADGLETSGLLIPRYEHADSEHIVLKLKSGYNIGIRAESIVSIEVLEEAAIQPPKLGVLRKERLTEKSLLLLSTGGTIASRVDYRTGAVHPALSAEDLYATVPELDEIANIHPKVVFSVYSENLNSSHWQKLSEEILSDSKSGKFDGVVVMLGTDTLAYVSAALSFSLIGLKQPVVCVGAQRSSDRPSSDAAFNLTAACRFAVNSGLEGVYVAMHNSENDDLIAIHSGVRVRKNHTSRRDAFESVDIPPVAYVERTKLIYPESPLKRQVDPKLHLKTNFSDKVALVKFYPGFDLSLLDVLVQRGIRGFVIEGTGLGHVSSEAVSKISEMTKKGIFVGITSQCIWGHVDLNVYDTGRDLIAAGAVALENMLGETAFVKLCWVLGNFSGSEIEQMMKTNIVGESTSRTALK